MKTIVKNRLKECLEKNILYFEYKGLSENLNNYNQKIKKFIDDSDPIGFILCLLKEDLKKAVDIVTTSISNLEEKIEGFVKPLIESTAKEIPKRLKNSVEDLNSNHKKLINYVNSKIDNKELIPLEVIKHEHEVEYKRDHDAFKINLFIDDIHRYNFWLEIKEQYQEFLKIAAEKNKELQKIRENPNFDEDYHTNGYCLASIKKINQKVKEDNIDEEVLAYYTTNNLNGNNSQ